MAAARTAAGAVLAWALVGCAAPDPYGAPPIREHLTRVDAVGDCARGFLAADRAVAAAGTRDAQDTIVAGFPYLRTDRLGASLAAAADAEERWKPWRDRLAAHDRIARDHEARNTGADSVPPAGRSLDDCRHLLAQSDDHDAARVALRRAARVPDDYDDALRTLGLYPLTRLAFAAGVRSWHDEARAAFAQSEHAPATDHVPRRYLPTPAGPAPGPAGPVIDGRDALGVPRLRDLHGLAWRHAPVIEVAEAGEHDRIGPLVLRADGAAPRVDTGQPPVLYVRAAVGRLGGALRPQLVYTAWFAARPKPHALDLLGGELDALIWRVTLDDDGEALVFDSIHACGCWHQFFATARVRPRDGPAPGQDALDEGLFMPQPPLPPAPPEARVLLRIASGTHQLRGVRWIVEPGAPPAAGGTFGYHLADDDRLRSLPVPQPAPGGPSSRSAFGPDGLVPGSQRLERFVFWPMGIDSAGQMRQWGRHATAFVGRRHFDDPDLLERYFTLSDPAAQRR
jgi:hypothetical protein